MARTGPAAAVRLLTRGSALAGLLLTGFALLAGPRPGWWLAYAAPAVALSVTAADVLARTVPWRWRLPLAREPRRAGSPSGPGCPDLLQIALAVALAVAPGAWAVVAVTVGAALAPARRRQPRAKRGADLSRIFACSALASALALLAGGGVVGAAVGMLGCWLLDSSLCVAAVAATTRRPAWPMLRRTALPAGIATAANLTLALLVVHVEQRAPVGLLGILVPLVLLWSSRDAHARRADEVRLLTELSRAQAPSRSADGSAQSLVTAAARLLGGADVELVVVAADGPVVHRGQESGLVTRARTTEAVFDERWVRDALARGTVRAGRVEDRPQLCAVLGSADRPLAVLRARRGPHATSFRRGELRLAELLVTQCGLWLGAGELAGLAGGAGPAGEALLEQSPSAGPALTVLREAADRLARLNPDDVAEALDELLVVERAAAAVVGALGAPRPEHAGAIVAPRAKTEWTTTGVLP